MEGEEEFRPPLTDDNMDKGTERRTAPAPESVRRFVNKILGPEGDNLWSENNLPFYKDNQLGWIQHTPYSYATAKQAFTASQQEGKEEEEEEDDTPAKDNEGQPRETRSLYRIFKGKNNKPNKSLGRGGRAQALLSRVEAARTGPTSPTSATSTTAPALPPAQQQQQRSRCRLPHTQGRNVGDRGLLSPPQRKFFGPGLTCCWTAHRTGAWRG